MEALKMQKMEEVSEASSKLGDAMERISTMTSQIEVLEKDLQITRAKNLEQKVELDCALKTHVEGARGKIQSLMDCIEEEANRYGALQKELDPQRTLSICTQTSDGSSQDHKLASLSSRDQEHCAVTHYSSSCFL
uniref:AlNc14C41G3496 protein n=1 Tax=Albugo laibachii Nc14 TaxID=890382 RepID=F0W9P1_9STRA|nr:AlNc14C41G3496 [Albugo laibachii Nc14]|eukprot:CCA17859.1 AlNc14C41G3496 [Albugo laibachii Nc14]